MIQSILLYEFAHIGHPDDVRFRHKSAPLTDQKRCNIILMDIKPVIVPAVFHQAVIGITALKPRLFIYSRAIIVRRIYKLVLIFAEVNRVICDTAQVSAPPVEIIIILIRRCIIAILLDINRIDLSSFHKHEYIRILRQYGICCSLCRVFPVVLRLRIVPDCRAVALVWLSVWLILQVVGDDRIIIFIPLRHPRKCRKILVRRNTVGVPQVHHMTARIRFCTMDIDNQL